MKLSEIKKQCEEFRKHRAPLSCDNIELIVSWAERARAALSVQLKHAEAHVEACFAVDTSQTVREIEEMQALLAELNT